MALSTFVTNYTAGTVKIVDNTGTPIECNVTADAGDLSLSGVGFESSNEVTDYFSRGVYLSSAYSDQRERTGSLTCYIKDLTNATAGNVFDAVGKRGAFASGVSFAGTGTKVPWIVKITWTVEQSNFTTGATDSSVVMLKCRFTGIDIAEGNPNTAKISWKILGDVTGDLAGASMF